MSSIQKQQNTDKYKESADFSSGNTFLPNAAFYLEILGSQRDGKTALPNELGLNHEDFNTLIETHFSGIRCLTAIDPKTSEKGEIRAQLLELRESEWQEIVDLLIQHRANIDISEVWMAKTIAAACLGSSHLWRDLGLPSRETLKKIILENFPTLAIRNEKSMRWKKFFYRQLCEQQGHFICRSPTCETCSTYHECFGEEQ